MWLLFDNSYCYNGYLSDFRFYQSALLTQEEVNRIYLGNVIFYKNKLELINPTVKGLLGINNDNPRYELDVKGDIKCAELYTREIIPNYEQDFLKI